MAVPDFLAGPLFHLLYTIDRRREGAPIPPIRRSIRPVPDRERSAFDQLLEETLARRGPAPMEYTLAYPKIDFLNYLCDWRGLVAHGSPLQELTVLEPIRRSSDTSEFGSRPQVFCSPDAIWAMWFAILDKRKYKSTRNGSVRRGRGRKRVKYYHFELPASGREDPPFSDGMIYILPGQKISRTIAPILCWSGLMRKSRNGEAAGRSSRSRGSGFLRLSFPIWTASSSVCKDRPKSS